MGLVRHAKEYSHINLLDVDSPTCVSLSLSVVPSFSEFCMSSASVLLPSSTVPAGMLVDIVEKVVVDVLLDEVELVLDEVVVEVVGESVLVLVVGLVVGVVVVVGAVVVVSFMVVLSLAVVVGVVIVVVGVVALVVCVVVVVGEMVDVDVVSNPPPQVTVILAK